MTTSSSSNTTSSCPTTKEQQQQQQRVTDVVYAKPQNAKTIKTFLEQRNFLDKRYRMTKAIITSSSSSGTTTINTNTEIFPSSCIAIPITKRFLERYNNGHLFGDDDETISSLLMGCGVQMCPFSTVVLGNQAGHYFNVTSRSVTTTMTSIQQSIFEVLKQPNDYDDHDKMDLLMERILALDGTICPKKLEKLGDDTLVIPRKALTLDDGCFRSLFTDYNDHEFSFTGMKRDIIYLASLWNYLAKAHKCQRVVRRGEIDPNSKVRESGHRILWPYCGSYDGIPETTGPKSPGWITITEQNISQSFDFTRVMFSRGNVTEKIRFGKLTKPNDVILDMYAGIGYYTLPALIHGHARHVHACEWNPHAVAALTHNAERNGVASKVTIHRGDCRRIVPSLKIKFDRVNLGLLPSSEGGWGAAVGALTDGGGWMHVHGNVPRVERRRWVVWVCRSLMGLVEREGREWDVVCTGVTKVKSFAPRVDHCVADVFLGMWSGGGAGGGGIVGLVDNGMFVVCDERVDPPSCALGKHGVLCQDWMTG